jgi:hypothetical protein
MLHGFALHFVQPRGWPGKRFGKGLYTPEDSKYIMPLHLKKSKMD